jgi:energy-coupling factor transporter ATP-binding protein EcfA2
MFDSVRFQSFKCLADVTIELGRMTLLVGANASGKSSVLDGLNLLCQLGLPHPTDQSFAAWRVGRVFSDANAPSRLRTVGRSGGVWLEAGTRRAKDRTVALRVTADPSSSTVVETFDLEFAAENGSKRSLTVPPNNQGVIDFFRELEGRGFGRAARLRLDSARVAAFAPDSPQPRVEPNGGGTAAVIAWLAEQRDNVLEDIEKDLRRVVPRARRLHPKRPSQDQPLGRLFELEMEGGARVPADLLSEGTLLTIGLLTVLHGRPAPRLVLLDDFDRALHPKAQRQLVACVKDMLARNGDLQFICSTHSPYVLDLFDAEDVQVLRADAQGFTHARRLSEHPEWVKWKETLKPGEFWSHVGEDWLDAHAEGT